MDISTAADVVDLAIGFLLLEAVAIVIYYHRARQADGFRGYPGLLAGLFAGFFLLVGLRASLADAAPGWLIAFLAAALCAHLTDMWCRFRG